MRTAIGHGLLDPKAQGNSLKYKEALEPRCPKGNEVNIPQAKARILCGNTTEPGDIGMSSWKSYLFFLTNFHPGIGLSRDRVICLAEQLII